MKEWLGSRFLENVRFKELASNALNRTMLKEMREGKNPQQAYYLSCKENLQIALPVF